MRLQRGSTGQKVTRGRSFTVSATVCVCVVMADDGFGMKHRAPRWSGSTDSSVSMVSISAFLLSDNSTLCPKKTSTFYFLNKSVKNYLNQPILIIFGMLNPEKIWHRKLVHLPTLPVYCSHFTLGNPKKSFSTVSFIHTSHYLRYLRRKQTVTPLPTTPEKCHLDTL